MKDSALYFPELEGGTLRLCYRVTEAVTQRQSKTVKKLQCDNTNAMCEIQTLRMQLRDSEQNLRHYRRKADSLTSTMKRLNEKHHREIENSKVDKFGLEKRVAELTRENDRQKHLILNLKCDNEELQRQYNSIKHSKPEVAGGRPPLQSPRRSVKRSTSRASCVNSKN